MRKRSWRPPKTPLKTAFLRGKGWKIRHRRLGDIARGWASGWLGLRHRTDAGFTLSGHIRNLGTRPNRSARVCLTFLTILPGQPPIRDRSGDSCAATRRGPWVGARRSDLGHLTRSGWRPRRLPARLRETDALGQPLGPPLRLSPRVSDGPRSRALKRHAVFLGHSVGEPLVKPPVLAASRTLAPSAGLALHW